LQQGQQEGDVPNSETLRLLSTATLLVNTPRYQSTLSGKLCDQDLALWGKNQAVSQHAQQDLRQQWRTMQH
jgi:hypothetical protein